MHSYLTVAAVGCALFVANAPPILAQTTTRVSVDSAGTQQNDRGGSTSISADGRYVAFYSYATNLVPGDTNGAADIFVHDRQAGQTTRVSLDSGGSEGNSGSLNPSISADGRYVAFESYADNLVPGDLNGTFDVFLHDRQTGQTTRVSIDSAGSGGNSGSVYPSISADGRYVAFASFATNLAPADFNGELDVFAHDHQTGQTTRVSIDTGGSEGNSGSSYPSISADGRYVAFQSFATNLVQGDANGEPDVFVHDRQSGQTTLVSVGAGGVQANAGCLHPSISADGRQVAFETMASNLVPADTNGVWDVFVHDRQLGQTTRTSVDATGMQANERSQGASISADGRFVAFSSYSTNLVAGDSNAKWDIFVHDRLNGEVVRASVGANGVQANSSSGDASISADGLVVAFESAATNLVPADSNNTWDAFVHENPFALPTSYCTAGTSSHGCTPAMFATGAPSASVSSGFTVGASGLEGQRSGIVFYDVLGTAGQIATPWGPSTSFLCVKSPTQRTPSQSSGGTLNQCDGTLSLDLTAFLSLNPTALGAPPAPGDRWNCQVWFRDPTSPKTTMLSDALTFVWNP